MMDDVRRVNAVLLAHFVSADRRGDEVSKNRIGVALEVIEAVFGKIDYDPAPKNKPIWTGTP